VFEIGNSLREARYRQQLELSDVEQATKIRSRYLQALEEESFDALPAQTYVKGFLRTYADYLGLDGQLYVDEYNSRYGVGEDVPREPVVARRSPVHHRHRRLERRGVLLGLAGIGVVVALFIAAFKFSGGSNNPSIPNLGTTTSAPKTSPAHKTKRQRAARPAKVRLFVLAADGDCWMDVRNYSSSGKSLYTGTLTKGQWQRFIGRRLWISLGAPSMVRAAVNGRTVTIPGGGRPVSLLVTRQGLTVTPRTA
jgi:cytoskeleton protein RodZ